MQKPTAQERQEMFEKICKTPETAKKIATGLGPAFPNDKDGDDLMRFLAGVVMDGTINYDVFEETPSDFVDMVTRTLDETQLLYLVNKILCHDGALNANHFAEILAKYPALEAVYVPDGTQLDPIKAVLQSMSSPDHPISLVTLQDGAFPTSEVVFRG